MAPSNAHRLGDRWGALIAMALLVALVLLSFVRPWLGFPLLVIAIGIAAALAMRAARRGQAQVARRDAELRSVGRPEGRAWRPLMAHLGHGQWVERLALEARWALRLETAQRSAQSRVGGEPLLPRDHPWPRRAGEPLAFVAQLDLAELRAALVRDDTYRDDPHAHWPGPAEGVITFFVSDALWEHPEDRSAARVLFFPSGTELRAAPPPADLAPEHRYLARPVGFVAYEDPPPEVIPLDDGDARGAIAEVRSYVSAGPETHVLGHADIIQHPMEETCERIVRGLPLDEPLEGALAQDVQASAKRWRLLLQLGEASEGMSWGGGLLYFWMTDDDLHAARFDRVIALAQSF